MLAVHTPFTKEVSLLRMYRQTLQVHIILVNISHRRKLGSFWLCIWPPAHMFTKWKSDIWTEGCIALKPNAFNLQHTKLFWWFHRSILRFQVYLMLLCKCCLLCLLLFAFFFCCCFSFLLLKIWEQTLRCLTLTHI